MLSLLTVSVKSCLSYQLQEKLLNASLQLIRSTQYSLHIWLDRPLPELNSCVFQMKISGSKLLACQLMIVKKHGKNNGLKPFL